MNERDCKTLRTIEQEIREIAEKIVTPPGSREKWEKYAEKVGQAAEVLELLNVLRDEEGATVTFTCENPDFNDLPDSCVMVNSDWTGWAEEEFRGDSPLDCLRLAAEAKRRVLE